MRSASNLLLLIIPESLLGPLLLCLLIAGGLGLVMGFRRAGLTLVITAVTIPIANVLVGALMDAVFGAMPVSLVIAVSIVLQLLIYLMVGWGLIKIVFGREAVNQAKGHLLADLIRWILRKTCSLPGLLLLGGLCFFLYFRATL
jgi:hypothetical protein